VDFLNLPLLAASALVFTSVLAGLFSARIGFSFLLVFLLAGVLAGVDGIGGYAFDDARLSFWVGNLALAVILLDGGLRTAYATFRTGLRPAALLASVGVLVSAGIRRSPVSGSSTGGRTARCWVRSSARRMPCSPCWRAQV
jgi:cell volume regulation protein A